MGILRWGGGNYDGLTGSETTSGSFGPCGGLSMVVKQLPCLIAKQIDAGGWRSRQLGGGGQRRPRPRPTTGVPAYWKHPAVLLKRRPAPLSSAGGLAILPFLYGGIVRDYHWAERTPIPGSSPSR